MTHPILEMLELNVRSLSHVGLVNLMLNIADALEAHPNYKEPPPHPVPGPAELRASAVRFQAVVNEADTGNRNKKAERDALRPMTEVELEILKQWAQWKAYKENDLSWITNIGIPQKKKGLTARTSASSHPVGTPEKIKVEQGASGVALVTVNKVLAAILYYVQICDGDPSDEAAWKTFDKFTGCRGMQVTGLQPGKIYHFRVRAFGAAGYGPWSAIVKMMVI